MDLEKSLQDALGFGYTVEHEFGRKLDHSGPMSSRQSKSVLRDTLKHCYGWTAP